MTSYRRLRTEGGTYFFTVVTYGRRPLFQQASARRQLREAWRSVRRRYPFEVDALCLLPDHLHCIWTLPEGDRGFSTRWSYLKSHFTRSYLRANGKRIPVTPSRSSKGEAAVWQPVSSSDLLSDALPEAFLPTAFRLSDLLSGLPASSLFFGWLVSG